MFSCHFCDVSSVGVPTILFTISGESGRRFRPYHLWSTVTFLCYARRMVGTYALEASPGLLTGVQQASVLCLMFSRGGADAQLLVCVCSSREPRVRADARQTRLPHHLFLLLLQWRTLHCRETGTQHCLCSLIPPCQVIRVVLRVQALLSSGCPRSVGLYIYSLILLSCQVIRVALRVQAPFQRMPAVSWSPFPHPFVC